VVWRERQDRIWFNPSKFWGATKDMAPEQVDQLWESVQQLAAARNLEALRRYDFIRVGNAYLRSGDQR
jgi:hypothetical protein